jgi:hypothetical protein
VLRYVVPDSFQDNDVEYLLWQDAPEKTPLVSVKLWMLDLIIFIHFKQGGKPEG